MLGRKKRDAEADARIATMSLTLDELSSSVERFRADTGGKLAQQSERLDMVTALSREAKLECDQTKQAIEGLREHICTLHSEVAGIREKSDSTGRSMDHLLDDAYISMESHGERLKGISEGLAAKTALLEQTQGHCSDLFERLTDLEARHEDLLAAWNAEMFAFKTKGCGAHREPDEHSVPEEPLLIREEQDVHRSCPMCRLVMWPVRIFRRCICGVMRSCGLA